jgi:hypothetical protein
MDDISQLIQKSGISILQIRVNSGCDLIVVVDQSLLDGCIVIIGIILAFFLQCQQVLLESEVVQFFNLRSLGVVILGVHLITTLYY